MSRRGWGATGVFRSNRIQHCPFDQTNKKRGRGYFQSFSIESHDGNPVTLTQVVDSSLVTVGSNIYSIYPLSMMNRWVKETATREEILFPHTLSQYNQSMGGTDELNWFFNTYKTQMRSKKYYMKHFEFLLSSSLFNSWILYRKSGQESLPYLKFLMIISYHLLSFSSRPKIGRPSQSQTIATSAASASSCSHMIRKYDDTKYPNCKLCKKSRTAYYCSTCLVSLHPDCFYLYHQRHARADC